jgi:Cdc6-like AAA superfamily ATPase
MTKKHKKEPQLPSLSAIFTKTPPLGGSVAELERELASYYIGKDATVGPIRSNLPGLFIFTGPKGVGKSALQRIIEEERETFDAKIFTIRPDDISLWSLVKSPQLAGEAYKEIDKRWLNKTLWNYLFVVELLRQDYGDFVSLWAKLSSVFSTDRSRIKHLIERGISVGERGSFSDRFLQLIDEIKVGGKIGEAETNVNVKLRTETARENVLHDLTSVVGKLNTLLRHNYLVLLDDLDLNWSGDKGHIAMLEALLASLQHLVRTGKVSFVVALREDIYRTLMPEDPDKLRQAIRPLKWTESHIKRILRERISWATGRHAAPPDGFPEVFLPGVELHGFWQICGGNPRRALQTMEAVIERGRKDGAERVTAELLRAVSEEMSRAFLADLGNLHSISNPGLCFIASSLRKTGREFNSDAAVIFCTDLLERLDRGGPDAAAAEWTRGVINQPLSLMRTLLDVGLLWYKISRAAPPRPFLRDSDAVDERAWFSVNPVYASGLGL